MQYYIQCIAKLRVSNELSRFEALGIFNNT